MECLLSFSAESLVLKSKIHSITILLVACGCETWSLTLREGCRLRVFESRALRRIFWLKRDEVTGMEKTT